MNRWPSAALLLACACQPVPQSGPAPRARVERQALGLDMPLTQGGQPGDLFGHAVAVGDFNHDGVKDLAVGSPGQGSTGHVDFFWAGQLTNSVGFNGPPDSGYGSALAVGDFNGDGVDDLAVGAPLDVAKGTVGVLIGSSSGVPTPGPSLVGDHTSLTGAALLSLRSQGGDLLFVGAPAGSAGSGQVNVYRLIGGQQWVVVGSLSPPPAGAFGAALAAVDLDSDGVLDVAVGAPDAGQGGMVKVFKVDGGPSATVTLASAGEAYGAALVGLGPGMMAIGGPNADNGHGRVHVFQLDGGTLWGPALDWDAGQLGSALAVWAAAPDGGNVLAAGLPGADQVNVYDLSSPFIDTMQVTFALGPTRFGCALNASGDFDNDGVNDLVIGAETYGGSGAVFIAHVLLPSTGAGGGLNGTGGGGVTNVGGGGGTTGGGSDGTGGGGGGGGAAGVGGGNKGAGGGTASDDAGTGGSAGGAAAGGGKGSGGGLELDTQACGCAAMNGGAFALLALLRLGRRRFVRP